MNTKKSIILVTLLFSLIMASPVFAQTPRPTPTNVAASVSDSNEPRGAIFGAVYYDVNGDGVCVNSGVDGEVPATDVSVQFTSSNATTTLLLKTGADGTYGLVAAGESFWEVLIVPNSDMYVTSVNPQYVPVYRDGVLEHSSVNFCVSNSAIDAANAVIVRNTSTTSTSSSTGNTTTSSNAVILVPEAGASAQQIQAASAWQPAAIFVGMLFLLFGLLLEWRRRKAVNTP